MDNLSYVPETQREYVRRVHKYGRKNMLWVFRDYVFNYKTWHFVPPQDRVYQSKGEGTEYFKIWSTTCRVNCRLVFSLSHYFHC